MIKCGRCKGQHATADEVRTCYGAPGRVETRPAPAPKPDPELPLLHYVPNGTYTVVWDRTTDDYTTLRVKDDFRRDQREGAQMIELLTGPDNSNDFTGVAFLQERTVIPWKRYRGGDLEAKLEKAIRLLSEVELDPFREEYALRSGKCAMCGRKLTVPASLHRGLGPVCAGKE